MHVTSPDRYFIFSPPQKKDQASKSNLMVFAVRALARRKQWKIPWKQKIIVSVYYIIIFLGVVILFPQLESDADA